MDLKLLTWFAQSGKPFAMECAQRTDADKKGGHLAADATTGGLLLRESAQCPDADEKEFQNTAKYKYFNTNNLWVDLYALKRTIDANNGVLPLPVIKNSKTVDPRDKKSTKVLQLETAMGAAIASFEGAGAILIPRTRFAPVKTTNGARARSPPTERTPSARRLHAGSTPTARSSRTRTRQSHTPQPHTPQPDAPQPHTPQPHTPQPHAPQPHTPQPHTPQPHTPQPHAPRPHTPGAHAYRPTRGVLPS